MDNGLRNIQPKLKALGIYQIIGGIIGIGLTLGLLNLSAASILLFLIVLLALALYSYSIYCGMLLLQKRKDGLLHSKINQLLQVASIAVLGYAYQYTSGVFLSIGIDLTESFNLRFNAGISSWQININTDNPALIVNLNLLAVFLITAIDKFRKKIKEIEAVKQVEVIGQTAEEHPLAADV